MKQLVCVTYVKTVMVGLIKSTKQVEEYCDLSSLGIIDGSKLVRGFGRTESGGYIYGRSVELCDIISVEIK